MKEIKTIVSFIYKRRIFLLAVSFSFILGLYFFWVVKASGDGKFFFLKEDEVIYYCSAKLFAKTNSVQAEGCIDESVSRIGMMNWYGPGYHLVYGTLFKIFGEHPAVFPWTHFVLAMAALGLIFLIPISLERKLLLAIALPLTHQFSVYIFSFFPETLILFLAMVLTLLLALCYFTKEERLKRTFLISFILCVILFMLWRITFIFWLAGLIALGETKKDVLLRIMIFMVGVAIGLVYMKLFTAPPYASEMHKIDFLYTFKLYDFVAQTATTFFTNLRTFLMPETSVMKIILGLVLATVAAFIFTRNKLVLAGLLISLCLLGVMLAYYSVNEFFFVKQTAMLIPLLLLCLVGAGISAKVAFVVVITLLITFPSPFRKVNKAIEEGRNAYAHYDNNRSFEKALSEIPLHIEASQSAVILWDYREYDYGYTTEALLPFATRNNEPILYTTNIVHPDAGAEDRFRLHNRLEVDYILSRRPLSWPFVQQVHATEFYYLYKLLNQ